MYTLTSPPPAHRCAFVITTECVDTIKNITQTVLSLVVYRFTSEVAKELVALLDKVIEWATSGAVATATL